MTYDKDAAQAALPACPETYRTYPAVCVSAFEATGEHLITYGDDHNGYFTGPVGGGPLADPADAKARLDDTPGLPMTNRYYKHYKGGKYTILAVSLHESTGAILVTYRSIAQQGNWTRTLEDFNSSVPRFQAQEVSG